MSLRVFAPAKINLTLEVGAPRADGLHPLQSVAAFADVGDWVEVSRAQALTLRIEGPFARELAGNDANLVLQAARALAVAGGVSAPNAALALTKNLPIASGIGGGSSDAAATLRALNELWRIGLDDARLAEVGRTLGADVPVCVLARAAYMTGTGADAEPISLPVLHAVLVNPIKPLATAAVYRKFDALALGGALEPRPAPAWRDAEEAIAAIAAIGNQLEPAARALLPVLDEMRAALLRDARVIHVALSGSGATMFALTATALEAAELARELAAAWPQWWVRAARVA